ncbi:MAG: isoprenylcysteine carboxylmethyltransferase family protein [Deltaproteobacteria bacterium]|nr:isoprenylcysteine carboxylmethyltransferase family protein [Deltaproteobacteria bacterium]
MSAPLKNFQLVFFLLIVLVLMIQGWGDRQGLLSHPARAGLLAVMALSVLCLLFVPCELFAGGEKEIRRQRWPTFIAVGVVGGLCWFLPYADRRGFLVWPESDSLRYAGLACVAAGSGIRVAGMAQLGPLFSGFVAVQKEHYLVTGGCYRWVRHPIYTGSLLALAGIFFVFRSRLVVVALPLYLAGTLWRIADEERLLAEAFGQEYEQYRARTWRLLPFIY